MHPSTSVSGQALLAAADTRVTLLNLRSSQLEGSVLPHWKLELSEALTLQNNNFSHTISPEIGRLFQLQQLRLVNNSFSGHFGGVLPNSVANLSTQLTKLYLGVNQIWKYSCIIRKPQQFNSLRHAG